MRILNGYAQVVSLHFLSAYNYIYMYICLVLNFRHETKRTCTVHRLFAVHTVCMFCDVCTCTCTQRESHLFSLRQVMLRVPPIPQSPYVGVAEPRKGRLTWLKVKYSQCILIVHVH